MSPEERQLEKLNKLVELMQDDTITPKQLEEFLGMMTDLIVKVKDHFEAISEENLQKSHDVIKEHQLDHSRMSEEVSQQMYETLTKCEQIYQEVMDMKPKDGDSPDPIEVAKEATKYVIAKLEPLIPRMEDFKAGMSKMGLSIRDALEALPEGEKLRWEAIEGLAKALSEMEAKLSRPSVVNGVARGTQIYVDGAKKGMVNLIDFVAGSGMTLSYDPITHKLTFASSGGGGGGAGNSFDVTQTAHGFSVGDVVRNSGTADTYTKAKADSVSNAEVVGIVTTVTSVNKFTLTTGGYITAGVPTATAGTVFFLDPSTAGALTSTRPTTAGLVVKPLLIVLSSASHALFNNFIGEVLGSSTSSGSSSAASFVTITGTVDGSNTSFTATTAPDVIYVDGVPRQKVSSDGTVNWTGTTNITLSVAPTSDIFGTVGGGGVTLLAATGTVNGTNVAFTFTSAPSVVTVDGVPRQKVSSDSTVNWTGTTSITLSIAPTADIFAY